MKYFFNFVAKIFSMTYYSKVSYPLLIVIFITFFGPLIPNYTADRLSSNIVLVVLGLLVLYVLILHMFFNTIYEIVGGELHIKCGFFRYQPISIQSMKKITKSSSIISSPAASFDRLAISYGKFEEIIVSPKNKYEFAQNLQKINPDIINTLRGDI